MLGRLFAGPLLIAYWGIGIWGFILVSQYIYEAAGFIGVIVAFFIFPIAYTFTPLYAGFSDGYWLPAMVCYAPLGLMLVVSIVLGLAELVSSRR